MCYVSATDAFPGNLLVFEKQPLDVFYEKSRS